MKIHLSVLAAALFATALSSGSAFAELDRDHRDDRGGHHDDGRRGGDDHRGDRGGHGDDHRGDRGGHGDDHRGGGHGGGGYHPPQPPPYYPPRPQPQPRPPYYPPQPGYGYGQISAQRQYCNSDLCTYSVYWRSSYGNSTVVTVQIPGESYEKVMSCEGGSGSASAPWIAYGKTYVFRMYESSNCTADIGRYQSPSATATVYGGQ